MHTCIHIYIHTYTQIGHLPKMPKSEGGGPPSQAEVAELRDEALARGVLSSSESTPGPYIDVCVYVCM